MEIYIQIGDKTVRIEQDQIENEQDVTWVYVMEDFIFPALRGFGYVIDDEFTTSLDGIHQEYLDKKYSIPWSRKTGPA
jgi:hypothetical protein